MKKYLSLLLVFLMLFGLCACEEDETKSSGSKKKPTSAPTDASTVDPTEATMPSATASTIPSTEASTQAPTQKPTQAPTQKPTQAPTQKPTQAPTQKPTQAPTQKPTQAPTQKPTQAPTQAPTEPPYTTYNIPALSQSSKDITPATVKTFNGNITKEDQVDVYTYTAVRDGQYTFWFSEMRSGLKLNIHFYNNLGEKIDQWWGRENGESVALDLTEGQTYTIKIDPMDGQGSYNFNIGEQTPTTDVTAYTAINDCHKFAEQENFYTFTPELDGNYAFGITEVKKSIMLNMTIYDRLGEVIDQKTRAENGDFRIVKLKAGETYTCRVQQEVEVGSYTLNIGKQKETTNIVVRSIVEDSLEFYGQINLYTFTATAETHTLTFSEMKGDVTVKVRVENYLEETVSDRTYCENGDVVKMSKLTPGKQYTIQVCQDYSYNDDYGSYTFTLE